MAKRRGRKRSPVPPPPPPEKKEKEEVPLESRAWLRKDLLKTFLLTAVIIGIEAVIYWLGLGSV